MDYLQWDGLREEWCCPEYLGMRRRWKMFSFSGDGEVRVETSDERNSDLEVKHFVPNARNPKEKTTAWDILIALISEHDIATSLKTKNTSAFIQGRLTTLFSCPQPPMPHRFFLSTLKHLCLYKIQPFLCGFFCLPWPAVAVGCFQSAQELLVTEFGNHFTLCPPKLPKEVLCLPEEAVCAELLSCRSTAWCLTTLKETTVTSHYLKSAGQTLGVFLFKKWNSFPCMENETYSVSQSFLERSVK